MKYLLHNFLSVVRRYWVSCLLNVLGMAVALAAFYLIITQVSFGFGYNRSLKDSGRLYMIATPSDYNSGKFNTFLCRPLGEQFVTDCPEVECGGLVELYDEDVLFWTRQSGAARKLHLNLKRCSPGGLQALGFEAVQGSLESLDEPRTIAISSSAAKRTGLGIGDKLSASDPEGERDAVTVAAIYRDFPANTDPAVLDAVYNYKGELDNFSEWSFTYAVKLKSADMAEEFEAKAFDIAKSVYLGLLGDIDMSDPEISEQVNAQMEQLRVRAVPLAGIYYDSTLDAANAHRGNRTTDLTLLAVAILTILIALINFVNFFFALVPSRVRSVNTYKIFGVGRGTLVLNFILESAGIVILGLMLSAVLVALFLRTGAAAMLSAPADLGANMPVALLTLAVALAVAVLGSLYPAYYITSFAPALVLKGSFSGSPAGRALRGALIGFQFAVSIALIICSSAVRRQHSYMMNYDMGFDKENLLCGRMPVAIGHLGSECEAFESALRANPDIKDITWADGRLVNAQRMGWGRDYKGEHIDFQCYPVAPNFLRFMGIDIVEGRDFSDSDDRSEGGTMIFNQEAQRQFGIDLETPAPGHEDGSITAGICKDFNFKPLQYGNAPFAFYIFGKHSWRDALTYLYVRTAAGADPGEVMKFILAKVAEFCPAADPETYSIGFFNDELGKQYRQQQQLSMLISLFTMLAIVISLMGVFGLVLFDTQHRSREIAIRRVMGGSVSDILALFVRKYVAIVLASFAVAAPVSAFVVNFYHSSFAYHDTLPWTVYALALVLVMAVTVAIVALRSHSAATANPVDKIKSE